MLSYAGLEVFITGTLDKLRESKKLSVDFWKWLNLRGGKYHQEPSIEERFSVLLKFLAGHSLKEEQSLWTSFKNLKEARNSLVHRGIAVISKKSREEVTLKKALELSADVWKITEKIREWLPKEIQWPDIAPAKKVHAGKMIIGPKKTLLASDLAASDIPKATEKGE
jgi:hypothetical protein